MTFADGLSRTGAPIIEASILRGWQRGLELVASLGDGGADVVVFDRDGRPELLAGSSFGETRTEAPEPERRPLRWPDGLVFGELVTQVGDAGLIDRDLWHEVVTQIADRIEADLAAAVLRSGWLASNDVLGWAAARQGLLDSLPARIAFIGSDRRYLVANQQYAAQFGQTAHSIRGKSPGEIIPASLWDRLAEHIEDCLAGNEVRFEMPVPTPAGGVRHIDQSLFPLTDESGSLRGLCVFALDVHDRVVAEEALRASEERFRLMTDAVLGGGYDVDLVTGSVIYSPRWLESFGYEEGPDLLTNDFWVEALHPDDRSPVTAAFEAHIDGRADAFRAEYRLRRSDGSHAWCSDVGIVVARDPVTGRGLRLVGMCTDITERRQIEEDTRRNEQRLSTTLDSIGDAVIATDVEGTIVRINPVAARLTGWTRAEAVGRPLGEVLRVVKRQLLSPPDAWGERALDVAAALDKDVAATLVALDGSTRQIAETAAPIRSDDGAIEGVVVVFRDTTQELLLREQLRLSERMQAIGQLAGGIAHDFNNLLGGIRSAAEVVDCRLSAAAVGARDDRIDRSLDLICRITEQAAELTSKLLTFARKSDRRSAPVSVHATLTDAVEILRRTIDRRIRLVFDPRAGSDLVTGDATALQSAFLNLAINACQAMPNGGELRIETADRVEGSVDGDGRSGHIEVIFTDSGVGIPAEYLADVFQPFFTTREPGKGTGLGLSVVYTTVHDHGGEIHLESAVHSGTRVRVSLPTRLGARAPVREVDGPAVSGRGRVLLVDDEAALRESGQALLEELGYEVTVASNGAEAVALVAGSSEGIDLVLMDMSMPVMGGGEAFRRIRDLRPACPIIISTGYTSPETLLELSDLGLDGVLHKPFRRSELSELVAGALGGGGIDLGRG